MGLDKIVVALENIERENLNDSPEVIEWIKQITDPEFKLIDSLISVFLTDTGNHELIQTIFKVFLKFLYYQHEATINQLQEHPDLLKSLIIYVTETDLSKLSNESFVLFVEVCSKCSYKTLNNEKFVSALFNSISIIDDDTTLKSISKILTNINYSVEEHESNFFLAVFSTHKNARFFGEGLLRILNYENDKPNMFRILQCFIDIMNSTNSSYFYATDMESFINIALEKLESTFTDKLRYFILSVLERVTFYDDYYKEKYKLSLLLELMEDYQSNEEVDPSNQQIAGKIIENIRKRN